MTKKKQKSATEITSRLEAFKPTLKARFKVESIEIFGSFARGEQTDKSDVDLLVTFSAPYNLWEFLDLKEFLTKQLHRRVDLIPKDSIKSVIRDLLQEAVSI